MLGFPPTNSSFLLAAATASVNQDVTASAGSDAFVIVAGQINSGNIQAQDEVFALVNGDFSGTISAGSDATLTSYAAVNGQVTSGKDLYVQASGDVNGVY